MRFANYYTRFATAEDFCSVKELLDLEFGYNLTKEAYCEFIREKKSHMVLSFDKEILIFSGSYEVLNENLSGNKIIFTHDLVTRKEYRRQGLLSDYLKYIEKMALSIMDVTCIQFTSAMHRKEAHKTYLNNGYTIKKTHVFIKERDDFRG